VEEFPCSGRAGNSGGTISPLDPGGNAPTISHWFVCCSLSAPRASGSIVVNEVVAAPDGTPVSPLPTSYTAIVTVRRRV
jgi:hypothetical protein